LEQTVHNTTEMAHRSNPVMEPGPLSETGTWRDFISVTKVGITVANMLTVFAGLWLASVSGPDIAGLTILWTLLGTALVIMAGTCLNNYIDRDLDKYMERTAKRALPGGRLNPKTVFWMGIGFALAGTAMLNFLVNPLTALVGLIGLFDYVVVYTMWAKRSTSLSTIWGSVSGAVPIVMGWTAVTNNLDLGAWALFLWMFLWQPPHTLALGIRRAKDYERAGIPLLPVIKGFEVTKRHMLRWIGAIIPGSILLVYAGVGVWTIGVVVVLGLLWFVHALTGFFAQDTIKWARQSFVCSLIYLTLINITIIVEATIRSL